MIARRPLILMYKPPPAAADVVHDTRTMYGISPRYSVDRLHTTLLPLGDAAELGAMGITRWIDRAGAIRHRPFRVAYDRIVSNVLAGSDVMRGAVAFQKHLMREMGLCRPVRRYCFRPHITLVYDHPVARREEIDAISWQVEEFMLVESIRGEGRHVTLGRWPLIA